VTNDTENHPAGPEGIVPIFATPFAALHTGADREFNARLAGWCESQRALAAVPGDPLLFRGRSDLLESSDGAAGELRRLILEQASRIVAGLGVDDAKLGQLRAQVRAWCSIVQPNGHVPCQHFTGASWLAVYCVQAGAPDPAHPGAGVLRLYERRLGSVFRDASTAALKSPFRYGNHAWTPAAGALALFPAHVPHEVSVVRSATPLILVFAMIRFTEPG